MKYWSQIKQHHGIKFSHFWEETVIKKVNQNERNIWAIDMEIEYFFVEEIMKNICIIYTLARKEINGILKVI